MSFISGVGFCRRIPSAGPYASVATDAFRYGACTRGSYFVVFCVVASIVGESQIRSTTRTRRSAVSYASTS